MNTFSYTEDYTEEQSNSTLLTVTLLWWEWSHTMWKSSGSTQPSLSAVTFKWGFIEQISVRIQKWDWLFSLQIGPGNRFFGRLIRWWEKLTHAFPFFPKSWRGYAYPPQFIVGVLTQMTRLCILASKQRIRSSVGFKGCLWAGLYEIQLLKDPFVKSVCWPR